MDFQVNPRLNALVSNMRMLIMWESKRILCHAMPCPIISRLKMQTLKLQHKPQITNVATVECFLANQRITTCHMRHIFMPVDVIIRI